MKKNIFLVVLTTICLMSFGFSSKVMATGTTISLTITGTYAASYSVYVRIWDNVNGVPYNTWSFAGNTTYGGPHTINYSVDLPDDSTPRWVINVFVTATGISGLGSSATLTTEQYYQGNIPVTVDVK